MAQSTSLMVSFSQPERFIWHNGALTVKIPNGSRTVYHPRASLSQLKALLMPQLRLTRAGNISQHQPDPPPPQPYDFYLAQLIHYGLDFHFEIETAQRALEIEIRLGRLRVPPSLLKLERRLEEAHKQAQKKAHDDAMRLAAEQQLRGEMDSAIASEGSEDESEEDVTVRDDAASSMKRKKPKFDINSSTEIEEESSQEESPSTIKGDSDDESDTITVAPDKYASTSSSGSASSTSSEEDENARRSIPRAVSNVDSEASENDDDEKGTSSDEDPFVDKHDFKRIKLENAGEHKHFLPKSTPATAPVSLRRQPPPSQTKVRRIAPHPQTAIQPMNKAVRAALDVHSTSTAPASPNSNAPRNLFFSPDNRPSWTIPVRTSPSPAQKTTPKSVTFSQVQRETPSKVPDKERLGFSSAMQTPQGIPRRRTSSMSSENAQLTPLRSILKKTITDPTRNPVPTLAAPMTTRPEILVQLPYNKHRNTSPRIRRRKRKSKIGAEERVGQGLEFDGTLDAIDSSETSHMDKPFIISDIVNGKPISSQRSRGYSKHVHRLSAHHPEHVVPAQRGSASNAFMAVNSNAYPQHQEAQTQAARKAKSSPHSLHTDASDQRLGSAAKSRLSLKGGASMTLKLNKFGLGNGQLSSTVSGSRGSLVRAGQVY